MSVACLSYLTSTLIQAEQLAQLRQLTPHTRRGALALRATMAGSREAGK